MKNTFAVKEGRSIRTYSIVDTVPAADFPNIAKNAPTLIAIHTVEGQRGALRTAYEYPNNVFIVFK